MSQPRLVEQAVQLAHAQTEFPGSVHWEPTSVAQGDTGHALLATQLAAAFPDDGWEAIANEHFARALLGLHRQSALPVSVISGTSGMAFTARRLTDSDHLDGVLPRLDAMVAQGSLGLAATLNGQSGMAVSSFDLISGLSGVVTSLLPVGSRRWHLPALPFLVRALSRLASAGDGLPVWHTPVHLLYDERQMHQYPDGNLNCGLAHGIPGPLSALALTMLSGFEADDTRSAVQRLAGWLVDHQCVGEDGPGWPAVVPLQRAHGQLIVSDVPELSRDAWCYGTPGVARALYLAGQALEEERLCDLAIEAMAAVYRRAPESRGIDSPTFCHGVAGLLQITLRFAHDTEMIMFDRAAQDLTDQILARVDPDRPLGIATIEPGGNLVDQPGLLDGATGVCLVLLGAATDLEPAWDRIVGLA